MPQSDKEKIDDVLITLDNFRNWREGSESTSEQPTWIRIGRQGVVGRVTLQIKHPYEGQWYYAFYTPGIGGGSGFEHSLDLARLRVEREIKA